MDRRSIFFTLGGRAVLAAALVTVTVVGSAGAGDGFSDVAEDGVHRPAIDALDGMGVFEGTRCSPE